MAENFQVTKTCCEAIREKEGVQETISGCQGKSFMKDLNAFCPTVATPLITEHTLAVTLLIGWSAF